MLLRRRKKIKIDPFQAKVANKIVAKCTRMQTMWADFMQARFEKFSVQGKKFLVVMMCVLFGGFSVYLIIVSIAKRNKSFSIVTQIKRPSHILFSGEPSEPDVTKIIPEKEFKKIQQFNRYMDSLQNTKVGKKIYDSIMQSRPLLMDSVIRFEKLYNQKK